MWATRANDRFWHLADMTRDIAKCPPAIQATFSAMMLIWINDAHGLIRQRHYPFRSSEAFSQKWVCTGFGISWGDGAGRPPLWWYFHYSGRSAAATLALT